jgi:VIT1/CCC1 family predicted Fe2+/Mn2+ transporter
VHRRPGASSAPDGHRSYRSNWLRAAVLGANDGIVSTSTLVLGVAGSGAVRSAIVTAGVAGMVGGALSMAAGEFVSVSSQRDTERAELRRERRELETDPEGELEHLTAIYEGRGLEPGLAREVATSLTETDALGAHLRDELGLERNRRARPLQAAGSSAAAFSTGAILPLAAATLVPGGARAGVVVLVTLLALAALGSVGARLGGARVRPAMARVVVWGGAAMAVTYVIGAAVGTAI